MTALLSLSATIQRIDYGEFEGTCRPDCYDVLALACMWRGFTGIWSDWAFTYSVHTKFSNTLPQDHKEEQECKICYMRLEKN
jgi:hypothetical protein